MTSTRQKILAHLQKSRPASARELARALDTGAANVRHHLSRLAEDGRVTVVGDRHEGRGRPEKLYGLSPALQGDNLPGLLDALLTAQLGSLTFEQREAALASLGRGMAGEPAPRVVPLARRLGDLIERLNRQHYAAHWEAGSGGPNVIMGRCPYAAVIEAHPELCRVDAAMLEATVGMRAEQKTRRSPACLFLLR